MTEQCRNKATACKLQSIVRASRMLSAALLIFLKLRLMRNIAVAGGRRLPTSRRVMRQDCRAKDWFEDARVVEGDGLADAQADDTLLARQEVDVDQVGAAH